MTDVTKIAGSQKYDSGLGVSELITAATLNAAAALAPFSIIAP
jgi:hypothetical protein